MTNVSQQVLDSCEDKKFAPLAALLHELQIRSREWFHKNNIENAFDVKVNSCVLMINSNPFDIKSG